MARAGVAALDEDAGEFFERREARGDLREAVVPEGIHAHVEGGALELLAARVLRGEAAEVLAHHHELVDADPALVASLVAARAAALAVERHAVRRRGLLGAEARLQHLLGRRHVHLAAVRAELPRETLRE